MASQSDLLQWSFLSLLVGGALIVAGGVMGAGMAVWMGMGDGRWMGGMMGPGYGVDGMFFSIMMAAMAAWALLTGALVLVAAWRLRVEPARAGFWGVVALVAGALSLLGMGGWMIGSVAALVGGGLALASRDAGRAAPAVGRV